MSGILRKSELNIHIFSYVLCCIMSFVEIQTQAQWNLIGRSMTALPSVLSPSSILLPPSTHCVIIPARKKKLRAFTESLFKLFYLLRLCKFEIV